MEFIKIKMNSIDWMLLTVGSPDGELFLAKVLCVYLWLYKFVVNQINVFHKYMNFISIFIRLSGSETLIKQLNIMASDISTRINCS